MIDIAATDYSHTTDMTCTQYERIVYRGHTRNGVTYIKDSATYFWIDDKTGRYMEGLAIHCKPSYWYKSPNGHGKPKGSHEEYGEDYVW